MSIKHWPQMTRQSPRTDSRECGKGEVCAFHTIGELKDDPHHLLLLGEDDQYYAYDLVSGDISKLDPDDSWSVDISPRPSTVTQRIAS